jgi:hypothetical protein
VKNEMPIGSGIERMNSPTRLVEQAAVLEEQQHREVRTDAHDRPRQTAARPPERDPVARDRVDRDRRHQEEQQLRLVIAVKDQTRREQQGHLKSLQRLPVVQREDDRDERDEWPAIEQHPRRTLPRADGFGRALS